MEIVKIIDRLPNAILRKLAYAIVLSAFITVDFYFLHNNIFKIYDQKYIILLCICIGVLNNLLMFIVTSTINNSTTGSEKEFVSTPEWGIFKDLFEFILAITWLSTLIIIDYFLGIKIRYLVFLIIGLSVLRLCLATIKRPKAILPQLIDTLKHLQ